jgi:hypothetical protein
VILARRTGKPVSLFHIGLERAHTFNKAWDLFQVPYPFSRAVMVIAPPIRVPIDADSEIVHLKQSEIQATLERVRNIAESWFDLTEAERDLVREDWTERGTCAGLVSMGEAPTRASPEPEDEGTGSELGSAG